VNQRRKTFIHSLDGPDGRPDVGDMIDVASNYYKDHFKKGR
jgi:hypothetical protein